MQGAPAGPAGPRAALELQPGYELLYSTCRAAGTCRVCFGSRGAGAAWGCACPGAGRGWEQEEAHAAGAAAGQDGGADKGAVLLPGPSLCLEAALPPLGQGL